MKDRPKLRFAILCVDRRFPAWEAKCIEHLVSSGCAELVLLIRDVAGPETKPATASSALYRFYRRHWVMRHSLALRTVDLSGELEQADLIACAGGFEPEDITRIRGYELDFILAFGPGDEIRGDILQAARFGVWSYDHDSGGGEGTGSGCFRALVRGEAKTEVTLRRLGDGPDGGIVLHRGFFGTCRASWVNNLDRAFFGCASWCARVCAEIRAGHTARATETARLSRDGGSSRPSRRGPTDLEFLEFALRAAWHLVRKLWELLFHVEVWNVGFTRQSVEEIVGAGAIDERRVEWCPPHAQGQFIADPFVYSEGGQERVLVEELDQAGKGRICALAPRDGSGRLSLAVEIEHSYHMSYACVFCEGGATYCVPETYQSGQICLYRRARGEWRLERVLLAGRPFVDPTLFKHQGLYWLFFTLQDDGAYGNQHLHACFADSLGSDFRPHALNPLKCDIGSSRPAGSPLLIGRDLYRPAQDCSETYGGAVVLNRIVQLSPTQFEEVATARIAPIENSPYAHGLHTLNRMHRGAVIDGKKFSFDLLAWRKNRHRLYEIFT